MRAKTNDSISYDFVHAGTVPTNGWQQAGFISIAYRLAHFHMSRPALIAAVSALFYFS